jgi:hypothetical protein
MIMFYSSSGVFALATILIVAIGDDSAQAAADAKYPDWKGQWDVILPRTGARQ